MIEIFLFTSCYLPSKLRFEANFFREDSQSSKHRQKPERISDEEDKVEKLG